MDRKDIFSFQNGILLAQTGQVGDAYDQFCLLSQKSANRNDPDLLLWIAATTPSYEEAQRAVNEVSAIAPYHPGLPLAQAQLTRRQQLTQNIQVYYFPQIEAYRCPFCGTSAQPIAAHRVSPVGWALFILLIIFVFTVEFCWLGLLLRETVIECPMCNSPLKGLV